MTASSPVRAAAANEAQRAPSDTRPVCPSWCDRHHATPLEAPDTWQHYGARQSIGHFDGTTLSVALAVATKTDGSAVAGEPVCLYIGDHVTLTMGEAARLRDILTRLTRQGLS